MLEFTAKPVLGRRFSMPYARRYRILVVKKAATVLKLRSIKTTQTTCYW
jgi:hypothetical protein